MVGNRSHASFNPARRDDVRLLQAVFNGDHRMRLPLPENELQGSGRHITLWKSVAYRVHEDDHGKEMPWRMHLDVNRVPLGGKFLCLGESLNRMVDELGSFASEVAGAASPRSEGVAGTGENLTESVKFMAGSLTGKVRDLFTPP